MSIKIKRLYAEYNAIITPQKKTFFFVFQCYSRQESVYYKEIFENYINLIEKLISNISPFLRFSSNYYIQQRSQTEISNYSS